HLHLILYVEFYSDHRTPHSFPTRRSSDLVARVDPSDVVQEALADAAQELSDYLRNPPLPFYPWLRQLAWERLIELHRRHLHAQRSEEHTSELQSRGHLVCRLLLEKKKIIY